MSMRTFLLAGLLLTPGMALAQDGDFTPSNDEVNRDLDESLRKEVEAPPPPPSRYERDAAAGTLRPRGGRGSRSRQPLRPGGRGRGGRCGRRCDPARARDDAAAGQGTAIAGSSAAETQAPSRRKARAMLHRARFLPVTGTGSRASSVRPLARSIHESLRSWSQLRPWWCFASSVPAGDP